MAGSGSLEPPLDAGGAGREVRRITAQAPAADVPVSDWRGIAIRCGTAGVIRVVTVARGSWTLRGDSVMRER